MSLTPGMTLKQSCLPCRLSKVKCEKVWPCKRCERLDLICTPQTRGPGRPPTKREDAEERSPSSAGRKRSSSCEEDADSDAGSPKRQAGADSFGLAAHAPGTVGEAVERMRAASRLHSVVDLLPRTEAEVSLTANTAAAAFVETARRLRREGRLQHRKALALTRSWEALSTPQRGDVSRGASMAILQVLATPYAPHEQPAPLQERVAWDPMLTSVPTAQLLSHARIPTYVARLQDGASPHCGVVTSGDRAAIWADEHFSESFFRAEEASDRVAQLNVLPHYILASILRAEDRPFFFAKLAEHCLSASDRTTEMALIAEVLDKHGEGWRTLVRARHVILNEGHYSCLGLSFLRLPSQSAAMPSFAPPPLQAPHLPALEHMSSSMSSMSAAAAAQAPSPGGLGLRLDGPLNECAWVPMHGVGVPLHAQGMASSSSPSAMGGGGGVTRVGQSLMLAGMPPLPQQGQGQGWQGHVGEGPGPSPPCVSPSGEDTNQPASVEAFEDRREGKVLPTRPPPPLPEDHEDYIPPAPPTLGGGGCLSALSISNLSFSFSSSIERSLFNDEEALGPLPPPAAAPPAAPVT